MSFPKINGNVERSLRCKVKYQDSKGKKKTMQLEGWQARIFQHEYDHLEVRACVRPTRPTRVVVGVFFPHGWLQTARQVWIAPVGLTTRSIVTCVCACSGEAVPRPDEGGGAGRGAADSDEPGGQVRLREQVETLVSLRMLSLAMTRYEFRSKC